MPLSLDSAFGIHPQALQVHARRSGLLASNLANTDTPNFKAVDLDFRKVLNQAAKSAGMVELQTTDPQHLGKVGGAGSGDLQYRVPFNASLDGNTVDAELERARFAENALRYEGSLMFLTRRIAGLHGALKGN